MSNNKKGKNTHNAAQSRIDQMIDKFRHTEYISFREAKGRWKSGRVQGVFKDFMVVRTGRYTTTILWKDVLIGEVEVQ